MVNATLTDSNDVFIFTYPGSDPVTFSREVGVALVDEIGQSLDAYRAWSKDYTTAYNLRKEAGFSREALDAFTISYPGSPKSRLSILPYAFFDVRALEDIQALFKAKFTDETDAVEALTAQREHQALVVKDIWASIIGNRD